MESEAKRPRAADDEPRCRYLRFSNLPHGCSSDELKTLLEPLGKVEEVQVARASGGGMLALVEMSCTREATSAKRRLNEMPLRGSTMTVVFDSARNEPSTQSQQPQSSAPPAPPTPKPPLPTPAMQPPVMPRPAPAPGGPGGFTGAMPMNGFVNGFPGSKLPPFFLPERMERDVHENRVLKMRSVLWTAKEEDIRNFYKPLVLDRDAIEMGKDHAGRFSGMVYVRLRSTADLNAGLRKQSEFLCGRQVILQRLDPGTPNIFRPGSDGRGGTLPGYGGDGLTATQRDSMLSMTRPVEMQRSLSSGPPPPMFPGGSGGGGSGGGGGGGGGCSSRSDVAVPAGPPAAVFKAEPRPWPREVTPAAKREVVTPSKPAGHVSVSLSVSTAAAGGRERALSEALAAAPAADALAAVRTFLSTDPRLPPNTRRAMTLLHELRTKLLDDPSCTASVLTRHAFRSPFESAGVLGYTLPEIEACFGTRSADSVFWPMFQTFHTILPHQADDDVEDDSLADFLAA